METPPPAMLGDMTCSRATSVNICHSFSSHSSAAEYAKGHPVSEEWPFTIQAGSTLFLRKQFDLILNYVYVSESAFEYDPMQQALDG